MNSAHIYFLDMAEEDVASFKMSGAKGDSSKLAKQDLATLDIASLTPTTLEVMSRQATVNLGLCL